DQHNQAIRLAAFRAAPHAQTSGVERLIAAHGRAISLAEFPALMELLAEGRTLQLLENDLPLAVRLVFNSQLNGRAA
ncbi:hypothetical protein OFM04_37675, partial [Escherichia coli]|nr:hypothetical protein [Escherichia coli]